MSDDFTSETSLDDVLSLTDESAPAPVEDRSFARDDQGRFAANEQVVEPVAEQKANPEPRRYSADEWAEIQRANAPRQEAAQPQKAEAPAKKSMWEDPEGFIEDRAKEIAQSMLGPMEQQFKAFVVERSERRAIAEHGEEAVRAAEQTLTALAKTNGPAVSRIVDAAMRGNDPVGALMKWHKEYQIGQDPAGYAMAQLKRDLADPEKRASALAALGLGDAPQPPAAPPQQRQVEQQPRPKPAVQQLPISLNSIPSGRSQPAEFDMTDSALFDGALAN